MLGPLQAGDRKPLDAEILDPYTAFQRLQRTRLGTRILCTDRSDWVSFSPAFHWTDQKLRVHFFYCLVALALSSLLARYQTVYPSTTIRRNGNHPTPFAERSCRTATGALHPVRTLRHAG